MSENLSTMPALELRPGASLVLEAINPVDGSAIGGVALTGVAIYAEQDAQDGPPVALPAALAFTPTA